MTHRDVVGVGLAEGRWNGGPRRYRRATCRGPLLLVNGGKDLLVPEAFAGQLHRRYRRRDPDVITDQVVLPDRGHSLTIDGQWRSVAFYCLDWLTAHDL